MAINFNGSRNASSVIISNLIPFSYEYNNVYANVYGVRCTCTYSYTDGNFSTYVYGRLFDCLCKLQDKDTHNVRVRVNDWIAKYQRINYTVQWFFKNPMALVSPRLRRVGLGHKHSPYNIALLEGYKVELYPFMLLWQPFLILNSVTYH